jgi:hypothetical protein
VDIDQEEEASADRARELILQGAIVKSVLDSAAKGNHWLFQFETLSHNIQCNSTANHLTIHIPRRPHPDVSNTNRAQNVINRLSTHVDNPPPTQRRTSHYLCSHSSFTSHSRRNSRRTRYVGSRGRDFGRCHTTYERGPSRRCGPLPRICGHVGLKCGWEHTCATSSPESLRRVCRGMDDQTRRRTSGSCGPRKSSSFPLSLMFRPTLDSGFGHYF